MIVYSEKIIRFLNEIKFLVKEVLSREVGLKIRNHSFLDRLEQASYPINIVIFNNQKMLGYFDPNFYELGFHECLMLSNKKQLHNIIRHELAHYITFINYGSSVQPHGPEFRAFCLRMGWGEDVYKATVCLEGEENDFDSEESGVLRKVKKLMALANSANKNEAEQAMIKSQQLLLKHNIESKYINGENEEKIFLKRILKQKKNNARIRSIARILGTFFVNIVFRRTLDGIYLEILGNQVNIEIADYVATVLDVEFDKLWDQARVSANLKGMVAKNSFFMGIAKGYCDKIYAFKKNYAPDEVNAVMVIEKQLLNAQAMVYQRLSKSTSSGNYCAKSSAVGEQMGKELTINPAISSSKNFGIEIAYLN